MKLPLRRSCRRRSRSRHPLHPAQPEHGQRCVPRRRARSPLRAPGIACRRPSGPVGSVPYGARLRLRSDFPLAGYNPAALVILRTMQRYGIVLADGGTVALTAESDRFTTNTWASLGIGSRVFDQTAGAQKVFISDFAVSTPARASARPTIACAASRSSIQCSPTVSSKPGQFSGESVGVEHLRGMPRLSAGHPTVRQTAPRSQAWRSPISAPRARSTRRVRPLTQSGRPRTVLGNFSSDDSSTLSTNVPLRRRAIRLHPHMPRTTHAKTALRRPHHADRNDG